MTERILWQLKQQDGSVAHDFPPSATQCRRESVRQREKRRRLPPCLPPIARQCRGPCPLCSCRDESEAARRTPRELVHPRDERRRLPLVSHGLRGNTEPPAPLARASESRLPPLALHKETAVPPGILSAIERHRQPPPCTPREHSGESPPREPRASAPSAPLALHGEPSPPPGSSVP
jgi:hypothetical protein